MAKIGIATTQLPELTTAGGIAAVTVRLATELTSSGHEVFILVGRTEKKLTSQVIKKYQNLGITVTEIKGSNLQVSPWWLTFQYKLMEEVQNFKLELLICQEWQGIASLVSGKHMSRVPVISWLHGGGLYDKTGSGEVVRNQYEAFDIYQEQIQVKNSKLTISPSLYLVNFYKEFNWSIPESKIIPYHLPIFSHQKINKQRSKPSIIFVSALSKRKGFDKALSYVSRLKSNGNEFKFEIYGKYSDIETSFIRSYLTKNKIDFKMNQKISTAKIWEKVSGKNSTLLVPSRLDNSPGVIYEAVSSGVKVLVSDTQGGVELKKYFPEHIQRINFDNTELNWEFIASDVVLKEIDCMQFNRNLTKTWNEIIDTQLEEHKKNISFMSNSELLDLVRNELSVVIITKDRQRFFKSAIQSVLLQTAKPKKIIVIEDVSNATGEVSNECLEASKIIETNYISLSYVDDVEAIKHEPHLGQTRAAMSRNRALELVETRYVAFLDDDNIILPQHLESCMKTLLETNADAVTPFLAQLASTKDFVATLTPTQIAVMAGDHFEEMNLFLNLAMDSHICIKTSVLQEIGGFPVDAAPEDWALALNLIKMEKRITSTGEASVLYRLNSSGNQYLLNNSNYTELSLIRVGSKYNLTNKSNWLLTTLVWLSLRSKNEPKTYLKNNSFNFIKRGLKLLFEGEFSLLMNGIKKFLRRL